MTGFGPIAIVRLLIDRSIALLRTAGTAAAPPMLRIALALPFPALGADALGPVPHLVDRDAISLPVPVQAASVRRAGRSARAAAARLCHGLRRDRAAGLLLAGLATRYAALGLLLMTGVIQLTVPEGWANFHLYWAALALAILALGPGPLSLDALLGRAGAAVKS